MHCKFISQRPCSDEITILSLYESSQLLYRAVIFEIDTYLQAHEQMQKNNVKIGYVQLIT